MYSSSFHYFVFHILNIIIVFNIQKIFGVSIHPKYGGWFGFRSVLIFTDVQVPELTQPTKLTTAATVPTSASASAAGVSGRSAHLGTNKLHGANGTASVEHRSCRGHLC